ncbi:MAG TPA: lysophospholipid acyltransferase family protein [Acidobacteriaceae bacterium]|nr:lysophospholipid acyltransferase family protein [Acidobacteriaceae bacterium]
MTNSPTRAFLLRWLTYLVFIPLIALFTAGFGCVSLLCSLWDRSGRQQHAIAQVWARVLLWVVFSPVRIVNPENLQKHGAAVYVCNHLSYMDTPVLFSRLPFQFRILARHDLWKIPFIGWHLNRSGQIPVDSTNIRSTVTSLNLGVAALKSGMPLLVFPDGGRSADGSVRPFLAGSAWMAIRAGVPIVPLALVGTYELLPMHVYHLNPRPLLLVAGEPISTEGCTTKDADALTQRVFDAVSAMYYENSGHEAKNRTPDPQ